MTKSKQKGNPKFQFLYGGEHFNYYQYKVTTEQASKFLCYFITVSVVPLQHLFSITSLELRGVFFYMKLESLLINL